PHLDLHRLWPMFLVIIGFAKVLTPSEEGRSGGGAWMIFLGVLFLLHTYDIFRLRDSWPLFIVAGGVSILFGRTHVQVGVTTQHRIDRGADQGASSPPAVVRTEGDAHGR